MHIHTVVCGVLVSTAATVDHGLETMVFPGKHGKPVRLRENIFGDCWAEGADWGNPLEQYTAHYQTKSEAERGHKSTVQRVRRDMKGKHNGSDNPVETDF